VVELEMASRRASAGGPDERAAALVPRPDGAFHGGRNVARCRIRLPRCARSIGLRQRLPFQLRQQQRERAIEDDCRVAVRHRSREQILNAPEPVMRLASDRELELVTFRSQRPFGRSIDSGGRAMS